MPETAPVCRVAVVGAGYTAREHLRALQDCAGVAVVGIHSRTRSRAEALAKEHAIPNVCDSVAELHDRTHADLVVVTVVELSMSLVATACFAHPWTILMEKPPGLDLADALDITEAARRAGALDRVFVALNRRHMASTIALKAGLDGARARNLGSAFIKVQDQESQARALAAGQPSRVVDNWMFANAIHMIDYFRILGSSEITAVEPIVPWNAEKPGVVLVRLGYANGDLGLYEGIWHGPGPWAVSATVPGQRWEIRPLEQGVTQELGKPAEPLAVHEWDAAFKPGFRRQAALAVAAAVGGTPPESGSVLPRLADAVETMKLISRMFRP